MLVLFAIVYSQNGTSYPNGTKPLHGLHDKTKGDCPYQTCPHNKAKIHFKLVLRLHKKMKVGTQNEFRLKNRLIYM